MLNLNFYSKSLIFIAKASFLWQKLHFYHGNVMPKLIFLTKLQTLQEI
jgi:hypothetical protein